MKPEKTAREAVAEGLVTVADACRFLAVSRATLYKLMAAGELRWVKIGSARRVPRTALHELAARGLVGGGA